MVYRVHGAYHLAGFYFVSSFYFYSRQFAVKRKITAVLYQYSLVVSWHNNYVFNLSVKYGFYLRTRRKCYIDAVVEWHHDGSIDRVIVLSEFFDHRAFCRPR